MYHSLPATTLAGVVGATTPDSQVVDATFGRGDDGDVVVTRITPHDRQHTAPVSDRPGWLDLRGHVVVAAAAEPHAHLDKALSWPVISPPTGDLRAAVQAWHRATPGLDEDSFRDRARTAALMMLRNGITAVRTHVDIITSGEPTAADHDPVRAIRAVDQVRRELAGLMHIEIVALAPVDCPVELIEQSLDAGADIVGGAPHLADTPAENVTKLVDIAVRRGVGVDLHTDEFLLGDELTISEFARLVTDWPAERTRTAGHCCALGTLSESTLRPLAQILADARIGVVALPITNLYLQGREPRSRGLRGIAPIDELRAAGVTVAAGADNIRDPFNPVGRADPLETASLLITAAHQNPDTAIDLVTNSARSVMGLPPAGLTVGARADLLAVAGADLVEIIGAAPADRSVISNGVLVSRSETRHQMAAIPTPSASVPS
ncbi:amidohydrolase family protein [Gordonia jinhuaensis]|uniref:Cytosine deaminase n=1 Tax=Gordonia jinhuaensis TaxID=1517702 RepID=A0A916WT45_9ACTN|nr:amidohydrolase family protein [Gordonia jinhuaensis]GGB27238.1 cytosine deaminase [Gordonia jinhuaensis]